MIQELALSDAKLPLTIIRTGSGDESNVAALTGLFDVRLHLLEDQGESWADSAVLINRLIDDAPGWVLLLHSAEHVTSELAREIAGSATDRPTAWAFRIGTELHYDGGPLYRSGRKGEGEIRLFHARRCRFLPRGDAMALQPRGPVVRLRTPLIAWVYDSKASHAEALSQQGQRVEGTRRLTAFLGAVWRERGRLTRRAISYHWMEASRGRGDLSDGS